MNTFYSKHFSLLLVHEQRCSHERWQAKRERKANRAAEKNTAVKTDLKKRTVKTDDATCNGLLLHFLANPERATEFFYIIFLLCPLKLCKQSLLFAVFHHLLSVPVSSRTLYFYDIIRIHSLL